MESERPKITCKSQIKWFDQECETEKENFQSLGEKISHNINDSELRQLLRDKRRGSNKLVDGRNGSLSAKACLISICRTPKRSGDKQEKSLTQEKEKHMELKE